MSIPKAFGKISKISRKTSIILILIIFTLSILAIVVPKKASAAIAFDKDLGENNQTADSASGNTVAFTTSQTAASNSKIIVFVGMNHASTCTLGSVSGGSLTWNVDKDNTALGNNAEAIAVASADAPSGLASSTTITATFKTAIGGGTNCTSTPGSRYIAGVSFTGIATGTTYDGTNTSTNGSNNTWTGGAVSTSNANDLIIGMGVEELGSANITGCTASVNYTNARTPCDWETSSDFNAWNEVYQIVSSTSSYTPGGTVTYSPSSTSTQTAGIAIAYKAGITNSAPAAPTLSSPANSATGVPVVPTFQLSTTDTDSDYVDFEVQVCSVSNCGTVVYTACEVAGLPNSCSATSQTGWSGQNANGGLAYSSGSTATYTYQGTALTANTQYWWRAYAIDPGGSNTASGVSAINTFTTSQVPAAPTLVTPAASASGVASLPIFQLRTTDTESDYLKYFIQIYDATACGGSQVGSNIDQTSSQTNWQGQDQQSATAYTGSSSIGSSTMARYQYAGTPLTVGHLYSWRAKAIDPGGSQTFGSLSSCQDFTVGSSEVKLNGGVNINGGTVIQ
jgi:hypothetical protein